MLGWIRQAAAFVDGGNYTSPIAARRQVVKAKKQTAKMSAEFKAPLLKNKEAEAAFAVFSPSAKREYIEWIADAKRPETRDKRIATRLSGSPEANSAIENIKTAKLASVEFSFFPVPPKR